VNRSTLSLFGVTAALAAVTGVAVLTGAGAPPAAPAAKAASLPVERSALTCPAPSDSDFATTTYTSFTPIGKTTTSSTGAGSAKLVPVAGASGKAKSKAVAPLSTPGKPATGSADTATAPALLGTADGKLAPGWTVQQTTVIDTGPDRGVLGTACTQPDSEFWFPGTSTSADRSDYVHLTNPDDTAAVVDLELYGTNGALTTTTGNGITVPPKSTVPVLLSTLTATKAADLTLHVTARTGRVGASVLASTAKAGGDWLPAAADPAGSVVLPGIPADATDVRLVAYATGQDDADLKVRLLSASGAITPAGHETLHVKSGMTASADLADLTKGETGSLVLTPSDPKAAAPVVAALRITRGKGANQETAYIPATSAITDRATAADNRAKGSTLSLTAPTAGATVKITSSAGTGGGTPVTKTVTLKAGTTTALTPATPTGAKGQYAVTVEHVSGGPVYGSRMLALPLNGIPMFTIQPLPDDRGLVAVPDAEENLSILNN
jgi:hypothetical protein